MLAKVKVSFVFMSDSDITVTCVVDLELCQVVIVKNLNKEICRRIEEHILLPWQRKRKKWQKCFDPRAEKIRTS